MAMESGAVYGHHARNDQWIAEDVFPGLRGGFFVEAGACGGMSGSATLVLERDLGWTGIAVEPLDSYYKTLVAHRTCSTDNRCLSDVTGGTVEFLSYVEDRARSGIAELNKNGRWADKHGATPEMMVKETVTLADLLDQHHAPETIHYLCLDVEGAEATILGAFDFTSRPILAVSTEGGRCDQLLADAGYRRVENRHAPDRFDHYFLHPDV